jgi:hypothetical protein
MEHHKARCRPWFQLADSRARKARRRLACLSVERILGLGLGSRMGRFFMGISIKNDRAEKLARQVAAEAGARTRLTSS